MSIIERASPGTGRRRPALLAPTRRPRRPLDIVCTSRRYLHSETLGAAPSLRRLNIDLPPGGSVREAAEGSKGDAFCAARRATGIAVISRKFCDVRLVRRLRGFNARQRFRKEQRKTE